MLVTSMEPSELSHAEAAFCICTNDQSRAHLAGLQAPHQFFISASVKKSACFALARLVHATYSSTLPVAFQLSSKTAMTCMPEQLAIWVETVIMHARSAVYQQGQ